MQSPARRAGSTPQGAQILLVEDEAVLALDLQGRLEALGHRVVGAALSGEEAVSLAEDKRPDLVLMDIMLQGEMDGIHAARLIRERLDVPVVYLTAYSDIVTVERVKAAEPFAYVLKPFNERELAIAIDVSLQRHRVESQLKTLERWLATTLSSTGDGVVATDLDGTVTYLNPVAERLAGWTRDEAVGRPFEEVFRLVGEATGETHESLVTRSLREGLVIEMDPGAFLVSRAGDGTPVDDAAAPIRGEAGRATGVVVVFRDASQWRKAVVELRESQRRAAPCETTEAGGVAHDFDDLLGVIHGYSQWVPYGSGPRGRSRPRLPEIGKLAERAAELTHRYHSRKQAVRPIVVNLNQVLGSMLPMLDRFVGPDILIDGSLAPDSVSVYVDPAQLEQLILNLAVNARDAMPRGGRLTLSTASVVQDDALAAGPEGLAPGSYVRLTVSDTGSWTKDDPVSRIFEPYFTTSGPGKSAERGLSLVRGIVEQNRGHIEAESRAGAGTTFKVYLPRIEGIQEQAEPPPAEVGFLRGREAILLVDDKEAPRSAVQGILQELGYQVLTAGSGREAIRLCQELRSPIDLVLADVVLPGANGPETVRQLLGLRPGLKAVFMCGYSESVMARCGLLIPGAGYVQKPFTLTALASEVRRQLDTVSEVRG